MHVPPTAPAAALLFEDALGGLGEGGHALGAALLGEGVAAGPRELAVSEGQLAGFGEGDEPCGAVPHQVRPRAARRCDSNHAVRNLGG